MGTNVPGIRPLTQWALAVGCAISVANLYYLQPLLESVAHEFRVSQGQAGLAATLGQVGYALGMLLIVPLGDMRERRGLVLLSLLATAVVALAMAAAPTFPLLCFASLGLGFATCTPQLLVPFAATLALPEKRGKTVGFVMSGLLLGILLARTVSGLVGAHFGWRSVYVMAAALSVALALALRRLLPESRPESNGLRYGALLRSLADLIREEPILRESALYGATMFAAFSAFWTTVGFYLAGPPWHYGTDTVGLFGLVGAAGAMAAVFAGKFADKQGPRRAILVGILLTIVAFGVMLQGSLPALIVGTLLMDVGVQASHISNQSRVFARRPEARNRMNTVYMTAYFVGGSCGSALGSWAWGAFGWPGVCSVGAGFALVALAVFAITREGSRRSVA